MKQLTNQWSVNNFRDERRQRLYLKDIDCPHEWRKALQKAIHPNLFYLNGNVSATGENESEDEHVFRSEAAVAPAGDLMSSLPQVMRAENLMCYIGHEGTFTPAHREMCASLGHNIMVEASKDENGEKPGSSIWFMTESKDRAVVREYFLSMLGHDIEIEKHFAQINAWKKAPFDVYIVEQRVGDFILVPPLAAHQVWNRGTRTMKVAWNRTTVETLTMALHEALPKARLVCRDEQYKNKAIIYYTLHKYHGELQNMEQNAEITQMSFMGIGHDIIRNSPRARQLASDFKKLFALFTEVLIDEVFAFKEKEVEFLPFDSCVVCSYCRSNVFNRFLTCKHCVRTLADGEEDAYDVCMECYAMGRSCACLSGLRWCEQWSWSELVDSYESWRAMVIMNDGFVDIEHSPQPLEIARQKSGKKSVAQICQEALRRRPWKDITKPERENTPSDSEQDGAGDKVKKKPKRKKKKGEVRRCHVCCHKDYSYRVQLCTNPGCTEGYCYGVLYRAFDMMPQKVLEDEHWQCPKCLGICNCGHCRRAGTTNPYTPKNTSLGHDTRPIADDRSVEALVDFRVHNLSWLKAAGEESRSKDSKRMQRLREQADDAKAQGLTEEVEVERQIQDENDALATQRAHVEVVTLNGYGDQSHVLSIQGSMMTEDPPHEPANQFDEENAPLNSVTIVAHGSNEEVHDTTSYPDPSVFTRQRIGMGYYEQDDTPDKILFDPYQVPSAASLRLDEPDVPEFVKKSIRAAKRRARRENEDPDFVVGKGHHRKSRLIQETDFLDSMDPALFHTAQSAPEIPMQESEQEEPSRDTEGTPKNVQDSTEAASQRKPTVPRFDANEPVLRHAKPMTSYVELDDADLEDIEELGATTQHTVPISPTGEETNVNEEPKSAIDLAADAVRAILGQPMSEVLTTPKPAETSAQSTLPRKRGRPPKRQSIATSSPHHVSSVPHVPSTVEGSIKRGRGRPRKTFIPEPADVSDDDVVDNDDPGSYSLQDSEPAASRLRHGRKSFQQVDDEDATKAEGQPRRLFSRRIGVTTIAAASAELEPVNDEVSEAPVDDRASEIPADKVVSGRKRGRPRKSNITAETPLSNKISTADSQFMSMAERMALRGRGFKIGKSRSNNVNAGLSAEQTPRSHDDTVSRVVDEKTEPQQSHIMTPSKTIDTALENAMDDSPASSSSSIGQHGSMVSSPAQGRHIRGPTVVRLADATPDAEEHEEESSWGGSSAGEDIPFRPPPTYTNGSEGGRGSGRGNSTGRGRGRPKSFV